MWSRVSDEDLAQEGNRPRWDRYEDRLLDAMQVLPLDQELTRGPAYRALYQPAFHADTCVTVYDAGDHGVVEVVVAAGSVRVAAMQQIGVRMGPRAQRAQPGTDLQWEHAEVPPAGLRDFQQGVAGLVPGLLPDMIADRGRDGMSVRGEIGAGAAVHTFHTWSPSATRQPEHYRYCVAVLDVALASVHDSRSRFALLDIRRYLQES
jgi:hypothetical protein